METPSGSEGFAFCTSPASARVLRDALADVGANGRRNFDIAGGSASANRFGVPVFVVTHSTPNGWPRDNVPFTFLPGVEQAVSAAKATAGEKSVVIASPNIAQQALQLGLLDEIAISLVPVLLGDGIPYFAKHDAAPVALTDPDVVQGRGVTHLRFRVK